MKCTLHLTGIVLTLLLFVLAQFLLFVRRIFKSSTSNWHVLFHYALFSAEIVKTSQTVKTGQRLVN